MTTTEALLIVKQPSLEDYEFCRSDRTLPFALRATIVRKWKRQLRQWERWEKS